MSPGSRFLVITCLLLSSVTSAAAAPPCEFRDTGRRMISPTNADDWHCMNALAAEGDAYWQFYVGLQLINGFPQAGGDAFAYDPAQRGNPEGLRLLRAAARSGHQNAAANAMNALARFYLSGTPDPGEDALAYQWQYLASRQSLFEGSYVFDTGLLQRIGSKRRRALEAQAHALLEVP